MMSEFYYDCMQHVFMIETIQKLLLENETIAMHCNLRPPDAAVLVL